MFRSNDLSFFQKSMYDLSYEDFDQKPGGWRSISKDGSYLEAANLIIKYVNTNNLKPFELANLYFHAGQMFACEGMNEDAVIYFKKAFNPNENNNETVKWNDYVSATIAFLNRDSDTLSQCRQQIASSEGRHINGEHIIPNLDLVTNMINNPDMSYLEVYRLKTNDPRNKLN